MSANRTKPCPACEKEIPANRGVCPECGHQSTWFKMRLYLGCLGVLFGFIVTALMAIMAIMGAE